MPRGTPPAERPRLSLGQLLALAGPVVLSRLGIMAMGLVDTVAVGRHSAVELGYLALAWAPTGVILTTSIGLLSGVQVMTSRAIGAGREAHTGAILRRGIIYAFWVSMAAALLLALGGGPFLHLTGIAPDLADGATAPLRMLSLSLLPILVADAGIFWLEAHGRAVPGMIAMWGANVVNLALNLWLVPGGNMFGVEGAVATSWATFVSRVVLLVFVAMIIVRWDRSRGFGVFAPTPPEPGAAAAMRRVGYAASLSYFAETASFLGMNIVSGLIGALAVAGWAIVINVAAIVFMIPLGLSTATGVMVGRAYGASDAAGVRRAAALGFGTTVAVGLIVCAVVGFGNHAIAAGYTRDPAVRTLAASALLLSCLFFVTDGLQVVGAQSLRARGDVWVPTVTHFVSYLLILAPLGYIFGITLGGGVIGIVWAVIVASLVSAGLLWGRFVWIARRA